MNRAAFPACCFVAAILHVTPFLTFGPGGTQSAGNSGNGHITLVAAGADFTALVSQWDSLPDVQTETPQPQPDMPVNAPSPPAPPQIADIKPAQFPVADMPAPPVLSAPPPPTKQQNPAPPPEPPTKTPPKAALPEVPPKVKAPPHPPAPRPSFAPVQELAAGQGNAVSKGDVGNAETTTGNAARVAKLKNRWGASIVSRVERQLRRVKTTQERRVTLYLKIRTTGQIVSLSVLSSSGDPGFDAQALKAARRTRFPAAPKALTPGIYEFSFSPRQVR